MLYRRNEKGRFEAVTDKGDIIPFEDKSEMIAFIELREELHQLLGREEMVNSEFEVQEPKETVAPTYQEKTRKIRVHKGSYIYDGKNLKKEKTA